MAHPTVSGQPYTPHPSPSPTGTLGATAGPSPATTPARSPCGRPSEHDVSASPTSITSGATTTVTVVRRLEPCYSDESRSHLVELYARPAGSQQEGQVVATGNTDSQGRVQFVLSPATSTDYSDVSTFPAFADGPRTVRVLVDGPRTQTTPHADCRAGARVSLASSTLVAGQSVAVTVQEVPNSLVDLYAYTRPSTTYRLVRSAVTDANGVAVFSVRPPANTRLQARQREEDCADPVFGTEPSVVLDVAASLSLSAFRNGVRDYTFTGRVMPAAERVGKTVSLYRSQGSGRYVLVAQTAVRSDGVWRIDRRFSGSGRFDLVARTGRDMTNAAGTSVVRPTVIH